ncbi:MAG TPA: TFIIB-type zinc ribbon-containing protein [Anaerolineae bacterium]|nr:TFIIB-type zinc ribbon-containing protein [Anaerolineae bacterium]
MIDSDSIHDLLVRGIAAAKSNQPQDKEEARYFLNWALRSDGISYEQQAEAWLWLSQVEDAPAKKRDCLENVLAIDPGNPLARRGLLILAGQLKPEDVTNPIGPDQPIETSSAPKTRRYVCPRCGGSLAFDPNRKQLTCAYCGNHLYEYDAIQQGALAPIEEQNFIATLSTRKAHIWELASAHTLHCQSCGAHFTLPPTAISGACPFCASPQVIESAADDQLLQPEGVLPFQFDADAALKHAHHWLSAQRFRPDDLERRSAIQKPHGLYLPFWTFDLGGQMNWHAEIAEQRGRYTEWVPRTDLYIVLHDDLLVPGSHSVPIDLIEPIADFNTTALQPYSADLLADWSAEIYQVSLADASLVARQRAVQFAKKQIEHVNLAGERMRNLQLNSTGIVIESFKLVLLPVWIGSYQYQSRSYRIALNGQTAKGTGQIPRSGWQKTLSNIFKN